MPILLLGPFLFALGVHASDELEACQLAIVETSAGNSVIIEASGEGRELEPGTTLRPGDLLKTGRKAWVDLRLCDGSGLRVGEQARFTYEGAAGEGFLAWAFRLATGSLRAVVSPAPEEQETRVKLRVRTPNASLGVRGTEFVVDADDERETVLHTLEGEVLLGAASGFEALAEHRGAALPQGFAAVRKEQMSLIRRGEHRPLAPAAFRNWEFRQERRMLLERVLEKRSPQELRPRFQELRRQLLERLKGKPLFQRPREKLEKALEKGAAARQERAAEKLSRLRGGPGARAPERAGRAEQRLSRQGDRPGKLMEGLRQHREQRRLREDPEAWRKNVHRTPRSPRFPRPGMRAPGPGAPPPPPPPKPQ